MQLKASGPTGVPLVTTSIHSTTASTATVQVVLLGSRPLVTFSAKLGAWNNVRVRVRPHASAGIAQASVNGAAFKGVANTRVALDKAYADWNPRFGFYRKYDAKMQGTTYVDIAKPYQAKL